MEIFLYILSGIVLYTTFVALVAMADGICSSNDPIRRTPAFVRKYKKSLLQQKRAKK